MAAGQTEVGPVIVPGVEGSLVRESVLDIEFPQPFVATTAKVPVVNPDGILIPIVVPVLETIVQLAGGVQIYPVAPTIAVMEYVNIPPPQRFVDCPLMVPGVVGTDRIVVDLTVLAPHELLAVTLKVPEAYEAGNVKLIEFVPCPLLITEPAGTVQL